MTDGYFTLNNVGNEEYFAPQEDVRLIFRLLVQTPASFLKRTFAGT